MIIRFNSFTVNKLVYIFTQNYQVIQNKHNTYLELSPLSSAYNIMWYRGSLTTREREREREREVYLSSSIVIFIIKLIN